MKELKKAIGYICVSTIQQASNNAYEIEIQRKEILAYADQYDYSIVEWKIDEISDTSNKHSALDEILYGDISNPPFEAVIIFRNDNVTCDTKLYFYYLYILERKNIKLLSTKEEFAEGIEVANHCRTLLHFVAEQERKNIALRTGKGRSMKAQCGGYAGGRAPYGYKVEAGRLVINEDERPIVEFVFEETAKRTPMLTIAELLREKGFRTRNGHNFQASTIKGIISNKPLYQGMYKYGKDMNWVQGVHEPILKRED